MFEKVIKFTLEEDAKHVISEEYRGFCRGRLCTSVYDRLSNLFRLQQLLVKRSSRGLETHLTFEDLQKAFDMVLISELWETSNHFRVNNELINIIKELYNDKYTIIYIP